MPRDPPATPAGYAWSACTVFLDDHQSLANDNRAEQAIAVSNGSYKEDRGAAFFVLQEQSTRAHKIIANITFSYLVDMDAYCSELCGFYGILAMTEDLVYQFNLINGCVEVASNFHEAIIYIFSD